MEKKKKTDSKEITAIHLQPSKRRSATILGSWDRSAAEKARNQQVPGRLYRVPDFSVHSTLDARVIYSVDFFLQASLILHEAVFRLYILYR